MRNKRNNMITRCIRYLLVFTLFIASLYIESINAVAAESYFWPTPTVTQLSRGYSSSHKALDIAAPVGTNIYATKSGTVIGIGNACSCIRNTGCTHKLYFDGDWEQGIGSGIIIKHDDGSGYSLYAHMLKDTWPSDVYKGAHVNQGQFIGKTGESGVATGPHLHFALRDNSSTNRWECNLINNNTDQIAYIYSYNGLGGSAQFSIFTNTTAESITESSARVKADMDSVRYLSTAGLYFGTDPSNMQKITENVNGNAKSIFYDTGKWIGTLQSNTTYWYQLYVVTGGNEYKTDLKSFTTTSAWKDAYTEGITATNAVIKGTTNNNKYVTTAGIYIGTDASNMYKVVENVYADAKWYTYDLNKWYGVLRPGTTYVYQLYTVYDGIEHKSNLNSFTTADGTAPVINSVEVTDVPATGYTVR